MNLRDYIDEAVSSRKNSRDMHSKGPIPKKGCTTTDIINWLDKNGAKRLSSSAPALAKPDEVAYQLGRWNSITVSNCPLVNGRRDMCTVIDLYTDKDWTSYKGEYFEDRHIDFDDAIRIVDFMLANPKEPVPGDMFPGVNEAISSRSNSDKSDKLSAGKYGTYKEIESALSSSTYYSWEDGGEYLKTIDKPKPGGLPKNVNFSGLWMSTDKSNVTGNKRIVIFPDLWHYIVLDFDEDEYLVDVGKYWKDNSKKLKNSNNPGLGRYGRGASTEEILKLVETELKK